MAKDDTTLATPDAPPAPDAPLPWATPAPEMPAAPTDVPEAVATPEVLAADIVPAVGATPAAPVAVDVAPVVDTPPAEQAPVDAAPTVEVTVEMVTVTVPKMYEVTIDHGDVRKFHAGIQEMPLHVANHWYSIANGVEIYNPDASKTE